MTDYEGGFVWQTLVRRIDAPHHFKFVAFALGKVAEQGLGAFRTRRSHAVKTAKHDFMVFSKSSQRNGHETR
jgi:hypothetical protein